MAILFLLASFIFDYFLFSEIENNYPETYKELGSPNFLSLSYHPLTMFKCLVFLFTGSKGEFEIKVKVLIWCSRLCLIGFILSLYLSNFS
jgi:hypothetical protein